MKKITREEKRLNRACDKVVEKLHILVLAREYDPYEWLIGGEKQMAKYAVVLKAFVKNEVKLALRRVGKGWDKLEGK